MDFGVWLRGQLRRRDWNQSELAHRIKASTGAVSMWARSERIPDPASCEKIADAFGLDSDLVLTIAGHRPKSDELAADDPRNELIGMIKRIEVWTPSMLRSIRTQLEIMLDDQRERKKKAT